MLSKRRVYVHVGDSNSCPLDKKLGADASLSLGRLLYNLSCKISEVKINLFKTYSAILYIFLSTSTECTNVHTLYTVKKG
jgi:hypothetical protein